MNWCWLFHRWGKWTRYKEHGHVSTPFGLQPYVEDKQRRECKSCGLTQEKDVDRWA